MISFAGLLELRGPRGHTVLDFPPGVLEAAAQVMPPHLFPPFVKALLVRCSTLAAPGPIPLRDVLLRTCSVECPGVSQDDGSAFRHQLWPRHSTVAELEGYSGILSFGHSRLSRMEPRLRRLLDSALAQESEAVHVAVLQYFIDKDILLLHIMKLEEAPFTIRFVFTDKHYSLTIPDDPRMHQLLLLLLAKMLSELNLVDKYSGDSTRGPGKAAADVHGTVQAARASAQEQSSCRGGGDSTAEEPGPGLTHSAGLLELRGPHGHTVRDFPPGVLEAAARVMPPDVLQPLVKALLDNCSSMAPPGPIPLAHVLLRTYSTTCCGVSQDHLSAFRKQLWPRHTTVAELEGYNGITTWRSSLSCMEPQKVLTIKHYSLTIPDDPHMRQLLLRLLAAVRAELQQPDDDSGDACRPGTAAAYAGSAEAARAVAQVQHNGRGGGASTSEVAGTGSPPGQAVGDEKDNAAPIAGAAADSQATGCISNVAAAATPCGLRRRQRSKQPSQQLFAAH